MENFDLVSALLGAAVSALAALGVWGLPKLAKKTDTLVDDDIAEWVKEKLQDPAVLAIIVEVLKGLVKPVKAEPEVE